MKVRVIWPGKTKKAYYRLAIEDYASRLRKLISFEIVETREERTSDRHRARRIRKETKALLDKKKAPVAVFLDASGKSMPSEEFAGWLQSQSADVDFMLGGPEGCELPKEGFKLSLGPMTLPHELARVVLLEQIFRAVTLIKKIPYHK